MRRIYMTIEVGSKSAQIAKIVRVCDPALTLGQILGLLRSREAIALDLTTDYLPRLRRAVSMIEELDRMQVSYEISTEELDPRDALAPTPTWSVRPATKDEIIQRFEASDRAMQQRTAAASRTAAVATSDPAEMESRRLLDLLHARWQGQGFDALLREERDYILLWELNAEATNGTLHQYLSNSSGDHASEALEALTRHGYTRVADVLNRALNALPGGWSVDRSTRISRLSQTPDSVWRALTDDYYSAVEALDNHGSLLAQIRAAYVRAELFPES